jgi:ribosomal-protein-alanine N-acetyltransferase
MPTLELLRPDHAAAVLAFETENRAYFAAVIPDRGDEYFRDFAARHQALLDEQATGLCRFHLLVEQDGSVLGRINLIDIADRSADLGYRVAEHAAGRGVATAMVRDVCSLAATEYGLTVLRAETTVANLASRRVLSRSGFEPAGTTTLRDRPALKFTRRLDDYVV